MKKRILTMLATGAVLGTVALPGLAFAEEKPPPPPKPTSCRDAVLPIPGNLSKVTLCHFTGSDSNPFIINEVSVSGAASHLLNPDHHGDCGRFGNGTLLCVQ